jgi:hypothetical protein
MVSCQVVVGDEMELLALDVVDVDARIACACIWLAATKQKAVASVNIGKTLGEK